MLSSKIFSLVMNARVFKLFTEHGTWFQFGGTPNFGCCDGLFGLKTMLNIQKYHNLPSHVGFVDFVKHMMQQIMTYLLTYLRNTVLLHNLLLQLNVYTRTLL